MIPQIGMHEPRGHICFMTSGCWAFIWQSWVYGEVTQSLSSLGWGKEQGWQLLKSCPLIIIVIIDVAIVIVIVVLVIITITIITILIIIIIVIFIIIIVIIIACVIIVIIIIDIIHFRYRRHPYYTFF